MKQPIPFLEVVAFAGGDHILPFVAAPSASRNNMVNRVCMALAVGTAMGISEEDCSARKRWC
jgi:hypothetical protein